MRSRTESQIARLETRIERSRARLNEITRGTTYWHCTSAARPLDSTTVRAAELLTGIAGKMLEIEMWRSFEAGAAI